MNRPKISHGVSKSRPRHRRRPASIAEIQLSGSASEPSSRPDMSVAGLSVVEVRLLRKLFDSKTMEAFRRVVEEYIGQAAEEQRLKKSILRVVRNAVSSLSKSP